MHSMYHSKKSFFLTISPLLNISFRTVQIPSGVKPSLSIKSCFLNVNIKIKFVKIITTSSDCTFPELKFTFPVHEVHLATHQEDIDFKPVEHKTWCSAKYYRRLEAALV